MKIVQHFLTASLGMSLVAMAAPAFAVDFVYEGDDPATGNVIRIENLPVPFPSGATSYNVLFSFDTFVGAFGDPTTTPPTWTGAFGEPEFWGERDSAIDAVNAIADVLNSVDADLDGRSDITRLNSRALALVPYTFEDMDGIVISRVAAFNQLDDGLWVPFLTDIGSFPSGALTDPQNYAEFNPIDPTACPPDCPTAPEPASLFGLLFAGASGLWLKNKSQKS